MSLQGQVPRDVHLLPGQLKDVVEAIGDLQNTPPPLPTLPRPNQLRGLGNKSIPDSGNGTLRSQASTGSDHSAGSGSFRSHLTTKTHRRASDSVLPPASGGGEGTVNNLRQLYHRQADLALKELANDMDVDSAEEDLDRDITWSEFSFGNPKHPNEPRGDFNKTPTNTSPLNRHVEGNPLGHLFANNNNNDKERDRTLRRPSEPAMPMYRPPSPPSPSPPPNTLLRRPSGSEGLYGPRPDSLLPPEDFAPAAPAPPPPHPSQFHWSERPTPPTPSPPGTPAFPPEPPFQTMRRASESSIHNAPESPTWQTASQRTSGSTGYERTYQRQPSTSSQGFVSIDFWLLYHIYIWARSRNSNIGSENGLAPVRRQAILWTNAGISSNW